MRPERLVVVTGTGTDVGKTWVTVALAGLLREAGQRVWLRKPAQSFDPDQAPEDRDAARLAAASGEPVEEVCPRHRWYGAALAPPMAAEALGRPPFRLADLLAELGWARDGSPAGALGVGLLEAAGGVRSPQAEDGDVVDLARALAPDLVVLVAEAGLGTINAVRLSTEALGGAGARTEVVLNRFDPADDLHRRNRIWLKERSGLAVWAAPDQLPELAAVVGGSTQRAGAGD